MEMLTVFSLLGYMSMFHSETVGAEVGQCGGKPADIFFLLDSSGSIMKSEFEKELQFTQDVTAMFDTSPGMMRVGALSFSQTVNPQFGLGEYSDKTDLQQKISQIAYEGKGTNTGEALNFLHTKGMSRESTRAGLPHIAVVLTDGMSQNMKETLQEAAAVHEAGISVFVIGIGDQVDKKELEAIGSSPSSKYVFMIDSFDALKHIKESLAIKACQVETITRRPDVQNDVEQQLTSFGSCTPRYPLDIVFAVDTASIGVTNSRSVFQFIVNVSAHINMAAGDVTIATVSNGCSGGDFKGEPGTNPDSVKQELAAYVAPGIDNLMRTMRIKAVDGRRETKHVGVIFITDKLSPLEYDKALLEMRRARFQKTAVFVVGVGDSVDAAQVQSLTVLGGLYLHTYSFNTLPELSSTLLYHLCLYGVDKK